MLSGHDHELVARVRADPGCTRAVADDPEAVARALASSDAAVVVGAAELEALASLARRVRAAEHVLAGARSFERTRAARTLEVRSSAGSAEAADASAADDGPHADHQSVRFALGVLVLAQLGGIAVFVVDGDLLAVVAPAVALVGLALVVALHQRPPRAAAGTPEPSIPSGAPDAPGERGRPSDLVVAASPTVRAAEAHLRRQQAAWKVAWWERQQLVPDLSEDPDGAVRTVVCVDPDGAIDEQAYATMTAGLPAVIRIVVLEPRPA